MTTSSSRQPEQSFLAPPTFDQPRSSIISNLSRFWKSRVAPSSEGPTSNQPTRSAIVPLFISAARASGRNNLFASGALPAHVTTARSTPSVSASDIPQPLHPRAQPRMERNEGSDMYGASTRTESLPESRSERSGSATRSERNNPSSRSHRSGTTRSGSSRSHNSHGSRTSARSRKLLSKRAYRDPRVNAKAKICFAFGVTLIVAAVIYLVLAFTGIARNTVFHVLSILLILSLTGIFCHQLIRMIMLIKMPRRPHRQTAAQRRRHATRQRSRKYRQQLEDSIPEKPIQIHMASDHGHGGGLGPDLEAATDPVIQHPPPVYGNFRTSVRMNPDYVHWRHVPPSPLTPTYDEALSDVQQNVGYRPPSYLSEGGVSEVVQTQARDVDAALDNIHPLERERMRNLTADALEGRNRI